jgi:adenylate kinase family enzyme
VRRVSVVGSTGTGKTTFARELASILGVPHVECDALFWEPGWRMAERETFLARIDAATSGEAWVADGNYGGMGVREIVWGRADTVIWLDFSLLVILARLWRRTTARIRDRAELWPGTSNRETIRNAFFSRGSLFVWALKTYRRRKKQYAELFARPEYARVAVHRFHQPREAERWLEAQRSLVAPRI